MTQPVWQQPNPILEPLQGMGTRIIRGMSTRATSISFTDVSASDFLIYMLWIQNPPQNPSIPLEWESILS